MLLLMPLLLRHQHHTCLQVQFLHQPQHQLVWLQMHLGLK